MANLVTPVVVDCPGAPKDIIANGYGKLAKRTPESVSGAVLAAIGNPITDTYLRAGAQRFDAHKIADQYLSLL